MKIRAAVLEEFGRPLAVQELDLAEPEGRRGARAARGLRRLPHRPLHGVGRRPERLRAVRARARGRRRRGERRGGRELARAGDHVVTLFAPECGECVHCRSGRTNRCVAIREQQGLGYLPDGTTRLSRGGEPMRHFMGTSTFAEYTVMPEIALAKVSPGRAARGLRAVRVRALDRHRRGALHRRVEPGSTCVVFGCGLVGLGAVIGARLAGAERIIAIDLSEERLAQARHHGATDTRVAGEDTVDWIRAETGGFGADYTFEATGNVHVMRQAVEAAREAWGLATMIGVAGKGETLDIVPRFLITGRRVTGLLVRRRQGADPGAAAGRPLARRRDRRRFAPEPPAHARRGQPRLRADGGPGRHPQRDRLRLSRLNTLDVERARHVAWLPVACAFPPAQLSFSPSPPLVVGASDRGRRPPTEQRRRVVAANSADLPGLDRRGPDRAGHHDASRSRTTTPGSSRSGSTSRTGRRSGRTCSSRSGSTRTTTRRPGSPDLGGADYVMQLVRGEISLYKWDGTDYTRRFGDPSAVTLDLLVPGRPDGPHLRGRARQHEGASSSSSSRSRASSSIRSPATWTARTPRRTSPPAVESGLFPYTVNDRQADARRAQPHDHARVPEGRARRSRCA